MNSKLNMLLTKFCNPRLVRFSVTLHEIFKPFIDQIQKNPSYALSRIASV